MANIAKREVTLFTASQNVDASIVSEIVEKIKLLKRYKPDKKMIEAGFKLDLVRFVKAGINIDTVMYLVDFYGFEKRIETNYDDKLVLAATIKFSHGYIYLLSEEIAVNVLSSDVKQKLFID